MSEALSFTVHGVWLTLDSNNSAFLDYAREHLAICSPPVGRPDIQVRLHWGRELIPSRAFVNGYHRLGRRLLVGQNEIVQTEILTLPGLQLQTSLLDSGTFIEAAFHPPSKRIKLILGLGGKPDQEHIYAALIYYLIYFPLLWHIERTRKWYPLHAAAVAWPQGAIVLAGLDGVGKSTITLAFLSDPSARLLSENLILHDKSRVYAFLEPIYLDDGSRKLLANLNGRLKPTGRTYAHNRRGYEVPASVRVQSAAPRMFCTLRQGKEVSLRLMSVEETLEIALSSEMLARELDEYTRQAATLNLMSPRPGRFQHHIETLRKFLKPLTCYELTVKPGEDLSGVTALVRGRLGW